MFLALVLFEKISIGVLPHDVAAIGKDGRHFVDVCKSWESTLYLGFYDWLRTAKNEVVGIRVILHDGRDRLRVIVPDREYIKWISADVFQVTFLHDVAIEESGSVDQEFSVSRCLQSEDGTVMLLFDAAALEQTQIERVLEIPPTT